MNWKQDFLKYDFEIRALENESSCEMDTELPPANIVSMTMSHWKTLSQYNDWAWQSFNCLLVDMAGKWLPRNHSL